MPSVDTEWWRDWTSWAARKAMTLTGTDQAAFIGELLSIQRLMAETWETVPRKGKLWTLALKMAAWILANPDPLWAVRQRMASMRRRWEMTI